MKLTVNEEDALTRLDIFLTENDSLPDLSRSYVQKLIKNGNVLVNHIPARNSRRMPREKLYSPRVQMLKSCPPFSSCQCQLASVTRSV